MANQNRSPLNSLEALLNGKMISVKKYPESFYTYPEVVQETLFAFYDVWRFPEGAVPTPRQKGKYALWVEDLHRVEDICSTQKNVRKCFQMAFDRYNEYSEQYRFILWRPLTEGMERLLIDAMMKIKNQEKERQAEKEEEKDDVPVATKESKDKLIKNLKSMFNEDD